MIIEERIIDADFRNPIVTSIREESDIICTNPPFSLFRDFLAWINPDEKKFLILSNINAITYKEVFPLIRDNKMWLGVRKMGIDTYFKITEDYKKKLIEGNRPNAYKVINGEVMARAGCIWFTNMDHRGRHNELALLPKAVLDASGVVYQKYDNYDAIEVPELKLIPLDYDGVMGVPISFLGSYNPTQFEIIGLGIGALGVELGIGCNITDEEWEAINKSVSRPGRGTLLLKDSVGKYTAPYARVLIKNK